MQTMTMSQLDAYLATLPADTIVVSSTYTHSRHTGSEGTRRGTMEQHRTGQAAAVDAPARAPDITADWCSRDGDSGSTRRVWIETA